MPVDILVAALLARFVRQLPLLAVEDNETQGQRVSQHQNNGARAPLLAATMPLTALYSIAAYGLPKLTPDANGDPSFVMPTGAIALDCFDALLLDLLLFYTALVFLSALSFWYVKHERARLVPSAPA